MQTLIFLIAAFGFYFFMKRIFTINGSPRERMLLIAVGVGILGLLFYMVAHGRFQFLAPLMAGLIPLIRRLPMLLSLIGHMFPRQKAQLMDRLKSLFAGSTGTSNGSAWDHRHSNYQTAGRPNSQQEWYDALATLGLSGTPDRASVVAAHRRLMQAAHPDHGGSHEEASRLNAAKDILLAGLGKKQKT